MRPFVRRLMGPENGPEMAVWRILGLGCFHVRGIGRGLLKPFSDGGQGRNTSPQFPARFIEH